MNAIYVRQSLDKKDSLSTAVQEELCRLELGGEQYKLYSDKGYSGKNTDRPDFARMMRDIRQGLITKVAVYKLDRLSRSLTDFANMIDEFKKYHVGFLSAREKFDTSTPIGNAMLSIVMVFAQLERETTQVRVRDSFVARMQSGAYDGLAPYGFVKKRDRFSGALRSTLEWHPVESEIVQNMFSTYAYTSKSLGSIARELNKQKILSPKGAAWDSCKLSRIMSNPIYVKADVEVYQYYLALGVNITNPVEDFIGINGCVTYGAWDRGKRKFAQLSNLTLSLGMHEGIIPPDTYLKCQHKLQSNRQVNNTRKGKHTWLTGLIKCGLCGYSVKVVLHSGEKQFICSGKTNYGICEDSKYIDIEPIEYYVEQRILNVMHKKNELRAKLGTNQNQTENKLKMKLVHIEEKIERLLEVAETGEGMALEIINQKLGQLGNERNELLAQVAACRNADFAEADFLQLGNVPEIWDTLAIEEKRHIAGMLISVIRCACERTEISWKYAFTA